MLGEIYCELLLSLVAMPPPLQTQGVGKALSSAVDELGWQLQASTTAVIVHCAFLFTDYQALSLTYDYLGSSSPEQLYVICFRGLIAWQIPFGNFLFIC